ncbi:very long chain fatty acid elongase AAEL008004-like [Dermacentor albipictus]|uniref:very long chain fatty acid elongase AAEL008004-like n=1 Tax=Dermacentor albipictus TaxID=60249 RepID=UPI0031FDBC14
MAAATNDTLEKSTIVENSVYKSFIDNPIYFLANLQQLGDPRTRHYPLVMNPLFVFPLVALYIYFVKVSGPRWMKDRPPFRIDGLVRVHNLLMVVANLKLCATLMCSMYLPGGSYSFWCQGITGGVDNSLQELYRTGWVYVLFRYVDFLDTVFFVLRKKFNQITHLHVIHHVMVTLNVWFWVLFAPEGQVAFSLALNSFVHVVMYSYYLLANMGPSMRKYLWWKKYLTTLQIVQFVIIVVHMSIPLFVDCGFPRYLIFLGVVQTLLVLALFLNFYKKSYIEPERLKAPPKVTASYGDATMYKHEHKKYM